MIESIYNWLKNIVFYLMIITAVLEALPGGNYQKYIRFFTGMVLMLLLLMPVLSLTGTEELFTEQYHRFSYEQEKQDIEKQQEYFENLDLLDFFPEEYLEDYSNFFPAGAEESETGGNSESESSKKEDGETISVDAVKVEEIRIGEKME